MRLDLLTQEEVEMIQSDVKDILEDIQYRRNIIYRHVAGQSFNPSTGKVTQTVVDIPIKAYLGNHSAREVANSGSVLNVGDVFFMFDPSLLTVFPKSDDRILLEVTDCGHVRLEEDSAVVVGYNTRFQLDGVQGGDVLVVGESTLDILSVTDDEHLTLKSAWTPDTEPATEYKIYRMYTIVQRIIDELKAAVRLSARRAGA